MGLAGLMRLLDSFWAFRYKGGLPANLHDGVLGSNLTHYAWAWLVVGMILLALEFPDPGPFPVRSLGRLHRSDRRCSQCHGVDALLPGLVVDLRRDRGARVLCTGPLRRPPTGVDRSHGRSGHQALRGDGKWNWKGPTTTLPYGSRRRRWPISSRGSSDLTSKRPFNDTSTSCTHEHASQRSSVSSPSGMHARSCKSSNEALPNGPSDLGG